MDPRNYRINALLFQRFWRLAKPYWTRRGAWVSWLVYASLVFISLSGTGLWAWSTAVTANLTNAIVARDEAGAWSLVWVFGFASIAYFIVNTSSRFIDSRLNLHWRAWLTRLLVEHYLRRRTYYDIALREDLDNPDQRIQEDVAPFVNVIATFPRSVVSNVAMLLAGGFILAGVTPGLFWFVVVYAVAQTAASLLAYTPTIKQNFESTVAEADLRYGILHVRDNAETVAFYRGEYAEKAQIEARLATAVRKQTILVNYQVFLNFISMVFSYVWSVAPYLLLLPLFFSRQIEFGAIAQATMAASAMVSALTFLAEYIPMVTSAAPKAVRLAEILERFYELDREHEEKANDRIEVKSGDTVELRNVCLETPGGEQALVRDLSLTVAAGQNVVVIGQTGIGKSSLLRAMAGLWWRGRGVVKMPPPDQCLFLPQRPYMILADLRSQLLYPHGDSSLVGDEELVSVLRRVRLPDLLDKHGGLDAARDWSKVLSLGEQQRIGFARILISRPRYVFLDEATSGVDADTEKHLYETLRQSGATYVSVGHRPSILQHHDMALQLLPGGGWTLIPMDEVRRAP